MNTRQSNRQPARLLCVLSLAALLTAAGGCATTRKAYYNAWENFGGYAKRERLVDNVKAARKEQVQAKEQFASALEQFKSVVNFDGGNLEALYNRLDKQYQRCEGEAGDVRNRIAAVKNVARALFTEWEGEVNQMKDDPSLQRQSRELLQRTRGSYNDMAERMDAAAATMDPVLNKFKNRVLFIKHNLNAQAIASLQDQVTEIQTDVSGLVSDMEAAINEANEFIKQMPSSS